MDKKYPSFVPTPLDQRIVSLDVIRGFALWGILTANIIFFPSPYAYVQYLGGHLWDTGLDTGTQLLVQWFVQGKFYTLFSLLFGYGFMLLIDRAVDRVRRPKWFAFRRMAVLLFFWHRSCVFCVVGRYFDRVRAERNVAHCVCTAIRAYDDVLGNRTVCAVGDGIVFPCILRRSG